MGELRVAKQLTPATKPGGWKVMADEIVKKIASLT